MRQYLDLCQRIVDEGVWVDNERTGKRCLTVINADLTYDVGGGEFPLVTTRKSFYKSAIAEMIGYIRGYDNAADFRKIGTKTWDANANENEDWLATSGCKIPREKARSASDSAAKFDFSMSPEERTASSSPVPASTLP